MGTTTHRPLFAGIIDVFFRRLIISFAGRDLRHGAVVKVVDEAKATVLRCFVGYQDISKAYVAVEHATDLPRQLMSYTDRSQ